MSKGKGKIQVIGIGVVGTAFVHSLRSLGYNVIVKDKDYGEISKEAEIYFICTQEKDVKKALKDLLSTAPVILQAKTTVIKSTMTPKEFKELKKEFPGLHLSTNPEFIRTETALSDSLNPEFHIIGECCRRHGDLLELILRNFGCPIIRTTPENALMIKLAHNAFLSLLISYWNEICSICKEDLNSSLIVKSCTLSSRIPKYGTKILGFPFKGRCLPKDLDRLIKFAEKRKINPILLKAIKKVNERIA